MVGKASIFGMNCPTVRISSGVKIVDAKNQDIAEDQHKLIEVTT